MSLVRTGVLVCGCLLVGCDSPPPAPEQPPAARPAPNEPPVVPVKAETPPAPVSPAVPDPPPPADEPTPTITADTKIGVDACDAYADRMRTCIADHVSAIEKDRHTKMLGAQISTWLAAKADPKVAPGLEGECAAAAEAARASTRVLGCVWREGDTTTPEIPRGGKLKHEVRSVPRELFERGDPLGDL